MVGIIQVPRVFHFAYEWLPALDKSWGQPKNTPFLKMPVKRSSQPYRQWMNF